MSQYRLDWRAAFSPRVLLAMALGLACGLAANWIGMPLPWMLGPMVGITIAALCGAPVRGPVVLRPFVIPVLGVMLGSSLTPEIAAAIPRWTFSMVMLLPFLALAATISFLISRRFGGFDKVTAYYSSMPGGLNEMILLGEAAGGDDRRIALAHAFRVLIVIMCISLFFGFVLGVRPSTASRWTAFDALTWRDWLILGGAAVLGVPLGRLLRLPARDLVGPMLLSGAAHLSGLVTVAPPTVLVIAAQLVIGTVLGSRFAGMHPRAIAGDFGLALLSSLSMILVATAFAWLVHVVTGLPIEQAFLAYSPGGLAEMSLLAFALHQDVAYVAVTHIVRIVLVIAGAAGVFRRV